MPRLHEIAISSVTVEDRFRKDLGDLDELVETIKEKGLIQPITVDQHGRLLAGGRRLAACKLAGLEAIPCVVRSVESDVDRYEIELIENLYRKDLFWAERARLEMKIHRLKGGSQANTAALTNQSVGAINRHLQLAAALELIPELEKYKTEDEAWKAMKKAQESLALKELTRRVEAGEFDGLDALLESADDDTTPQGRVSGPTFRYAKNNYIVGDALDGMKQMGTGVMDFAEVDPPYGIDLNKSKKTVNVSGEMDDYQEVTIKDYPAFLEATAKEVYRVLSPNSFCVWWFAFEHYALLQETIKGIGFDISPIPAMWIKGSGQAQQPQVHLASSYEPFFIVRKGRPAIRKQGRVNVFDFKPVLPKEKIHPTERPVELMQEILTTFTDPATFVLVPFLGSGATLRAVYREKMAGVGWDLSEEYRAKFLLKVEEDIREGRVGE